MRLAALVFAACLALQGQDVPSWVREAAAMQTPSFPAKVSVVELLREEHLTVDVAGKRVMRERRARRIVQPGRNSLTASVVYNSRSGKIRDFRAWLVEPSGKVTAYKKNAIIDAGYGRGVEYPELKSKHLECDPSASAGSVFVSEIVQEEETVFTTYPHAFQGTMPVMLSRFVLTLPSGWEMKDTIFNREGVKPQVEGNTYTWELRDLPWLEWEEWSPGWHAIAPRLALTYWPSASGNAALKPLNSWPAVSEWLSQFTEPAVTSSPELTAKAKALVANASTEWDKIRAIAEFAQQVNYISVQLNLTRGGGYAPNPAHVTLTRNWGDCKDKANLMRALLKAIGIESYDVSIFSGNRDYVRAEWPSPQLFNHAIIAVKVSAEVKAPTVLDHPRLGRLLFFDPTDPVTPLGDMPDSEQGSRALVTAGPNGDLVVVPLVEPNANRIERTIEVETLNGAAGKGRLVIRYYGQSGAGWRQTAKLSDPAEVKKFMERSISRRIGGVTVGEVKIKGGGTEPWIETDVDFEATKIGNLMQGRLLTIAPGQLIPPSPFVFPARDRKQPIRLPATVHQDLVRVKVPAGFVVDEMPEPVEQQSEYGKFTARWKTEGGMLMLEQHLELKDTLIPAKDYTSIRAFFEKVSGSQLSAVVLVKK